MPPQQDNIEGESSYVLVTADQWRAHAKDIRPALRTAGLKNKAAALLSVYQHHRIGRGLSRYSMQKGRNAAGAISYMAVFSLSAVMTVGWSLFSHFFSADSRFRSLVVESINQYIPGLVADPAKGTTGIIDPSDLASNTSTVVAGIIAMVVASWTAIQIVRYIVDGLRSMFGLLDYPGTMASAYLRYFAGLFLLFLAVLTTAFLSVASAWFEGWISRFVPAAHTLIDSTAFEVARLGIPTFVDFVMFMLIVRFVSRIRVPYKTLMVGAIMFAIASTALRYGGGAVMGAAKDPVLVAIATAAALLLWINLLARAALMISAWMADPPAVVTKVQKQYVHAYQRPNYVTLSNPTSLSWPYNPVTGDIIPAIPLDVEETSIDAELESALQTEVFPRSVPEEHHTQHRSYTSKVTTTGA